MSIGRITGAPSQERAAAFEQLLVHRLDTVTARCSTCGLQCPCPSANDAAAELVRAGGWLDAPFTAPQAMVGVVGAAAHWGGAGRGPRRHRRWLRW